MQVRDIWVSRLGGDNNDNSFHLRTNLRFGAVIFRHLIDRNRGDLYTSLNAYQKESDPTAKTDTPDFLNAVLQAWKNWEYRP